MNIQGQDKARVLLALFNRGRIAPMAIRTGEAERKLTYEDAKALIEQKEGRLYFDYLYGRCIKTDLGPDFLDLRLFDRDNGEGAGERAILDELTRP